VTSHDTPVSKPKSASPILCRPRFSAFSPFSQNILNTLVRQKNSGGALKMTVGDLGRRNDRSDRYELQKRGGSMPTGFELPKGSLPLSRKEVANVRLRGR
jgi:hypothetical protein